MKKIYLMAIVFSIATIFSATAQENKYKADQQPEMVEQTIVKNGNNIPSVQALWDIKFDYDVTAAVGSGGNAGVAYTGTEFWVSRWAIDSIYTLSPTGTLTAAFTIPGVTGVRAFTWDGQNLYAGQATGTIAIIDPATKTLTGTIAISGGHVARHITYDSTANSGAGGFWVGNFSTAIVQIDMSGNVLNSIPVATHGLNGMYGSAIDHWTAGAPYLWVFHQGGGIADPQRITRLQLPTGMQTGVEHDVRSDIGFGDNTSLAGGLFITNQLYPERTLVGILQGTPNKLFGYELNDASTGINDINANAVVSFSPNPTTGKVNIVSDKKISKVSVSNILGDIMYSNQHFSSNTLDLSHFSNGVYLIKVEGIDFINVQKIIIAN